MRAVRFHCVKYARRKPVARYGANGTSTPILEPAGLCNNSAIPITAPIQNEKTKPVSADGPTKRDRPNTKGVSAIPIARPFDKKCMSARKAEIRSAVMSDEKNAGRDEARKKPVIALAAANTARSGGGSI